MKSEKLFAVKIYHDDRVEVSNFWEYESADECYKLCTASGRRAKAFECRDGKTLDMYTEEEVFVPFT